MVMEKGKRRREMSEVTEVFVVTSVVGIVLL